MQTLLNNQGGGMMRTLLQQQSTKQVCTGWGFTQVELVVVVLILGALALVAVPRIGQTSTTAKANVCDTNVDIFNSQIELYYVTEGSWPGNLEVITTDTTYFPDGPPTCPFGTAYGLSSTGSRHVSEHSH